MDCDLLHYLKLFNRKERFFLIGQALGNPQFVLADNFRITVAHLINKAIPPNAFVAMDYHLDWIYAALYCSSNLNTKLTLYDNAIALNSNQEDVDLLIAFNEMERYHLVMLEAKAESGWTNKQFISKSIKLKRIFGEDGNLWPNIEPYFLITSPRKPINLILDQLPSNMQKPIEKIWFKLNIPENLYKITRCNELGYASAIGKKWKIEKT